MTEQNQFDTVGPESYQTSGIKQPVSLYVYSMLSDTCYLLKAANNKIENKSQYTF